MGSIGNIIEATIPFAGTYIQSLHADDTHKQYGVPLNATIPPDYSAANALVVLPDGRRVHILQNDILVDAVGDFIVECVEHLAKEAIASKGAFSMTIGSGSTVKSLQFLAGRGVDFSKVHVFFGNERTEGEAAGKCFNGGAKVFAAPTRMYIAFRSFYQRRPQKCTEEH